VEQVPERLAFLEQPEGIVDVREKHLVCYEAIEIYLQLLKKTKISSITYKSKYLWHLYSLE
jgi:hypothetical protein